MPDPQACILRSRWVNVGACDGHCTLSAAHASWQTDECPYPLLLAVLELVSATHCACLRCVCLREEGDIHVCVCDDDLSDGMCVMCVFDVYQGKGIDPTRKSLALGLTFQHGSRTLTDDEINDSMDRIVSTLQAQLGASLRN